MTNKHKDSWLFEYANEGYPPSAKPKSLERLALNEANQFVNSRGQFVKIEPIGLPVIVSTADPHLYVVGSREMSQLRLEIEKFSPSEDVNSYTQGE